jgi:hypothetical protein
MNFTTSFHIRRLVLSCLLIALAGLVAPDVRAHIPTSSGAESMEVSASEAKRIVRRYLNSQGFSKAIGPGGAQVRSVQLVEDNWAIDVALRDTGDRYIVYVDGTSGRIRETAEVGYLVR